MPSRLSSFLQKLFSENSDSEIARLKAKGKLRVGKETILDNLKIEIRHQDKNQSGIQIGDGSIVMGRIVLETEKAKLKIGNNSFIGDCLLVCAEEITIGSDVMFSWGCTVIDTDAHSLNWNDRKQDVKDWKKGMDENQIGKYKDWSKVISKSIRVEDKAWIGFNSILLKGITIGEGAVVAAGSVVTKSVAPYTLVAGNPAVEIKKLNE